MPNESEIFDASRSIAQFLNATAQKRPAPGGGSVTALVGGLCAAIGEMVLNYSVGRKSNSADDDRVLKEVLHELTRAREVMLELMIEDQAAFEALQRARKTAGGKGDRDPTFAAALLACVRIPQTVGATAAAILDLCGRVVPIANKFLLSDLAVCAELAMATVRCAACNVQINLADISDADERTRFDESTGDLVFRAASRIRQVVPAIWNRLA